VHIERQRQPGWVGLNVRSLVKAYFWSSWTSTTLALTVSNYATSLPGPLPWTQDLCVCGIIVSGRTCILMEMDSTAINISKYIYNGFAGVRMACMYVLAVREGRAAVQDIRGLSCRRCNGLIIRWAGSLWSFGTRTAPLLSNRSRVEEKWLF